MLLALALAAAPRFDAIRFFDGRTEGTGRLHVAMSHPHRMRVHGRGRVAPDGTLTLDQTVEEEGKPATTREWRIRAIASGRYAGTLTDARGGITGASEGDRLRLSYRGAHGVRITQRLTLAPDGRSAQNRLVATKFGVTVARLDETIRKLP